MKLNDLQLLVLEKDKISCEDVESILDDYVENELPATLKARVSSHICDCDDCQELEDEYRLTIVLAKEIGQREKQAHRMSQGAHQRLREALNDRLGLDLPMPTE